jgi:hypothetical protein
MLYEELTRRIIGCAMEVHRRLGNGFQACLPKGSTARRQEVMASTPLSHRLPGADSTFEIIRYEKLYESTHVHSGMRRWQPLHQQHYQPGAKNRGTSKWPGSKSHKETIVKLVYYEAFERIDEAFRREKQVQGWSRRKKLALINSMPGKLRELAECKNQTHYKNFKK